VAVWADIRTWGGMMPEGMGNTVDVYEIARDPQTRMLKLSNNRLLAIQMSWPDARLFFKQRGILASESKFLSLQKEIANHLPAKIRGIAFVGAHMYALAEHDPANAAPPPEIFAAAG
jgi:hypothetical protein